MNKVYDNGEMLLGCKLDILKCTDKAYKRQQIEEEDYIEIIETLKDLEDDTIVCLNYANGMGLCFNCWNNKDKVEME